MAISPHVEAWREKMLDAPTFSDRVRNGHYTSCLGSLLSIFVALDFSRLLIPSFDKELPGIRRSNNALFSGSHFPIVRQNRIDSHMKHLFSLRGERKLA